MKGTMKRIVSILLALALVITSLNYTPKTVSAADYSGLTFTEVTSGSYTYGYSIISNTLGYGAPQFLDNGITMQLAYSADYKAADTVVQINGEEVTTGGALTYVGNGLTKFNPSQFEDNAYTHIVITSTNGAGTEFVVKRGTPVAEEDSSEAEESSETTTVAEDSSEAEESSETTTVVEESSEAEEESSSASSEDYSNLAWTQIGTSSYYVAAGNDGFSFQTLEAQETQLLIIPQVAAGNTPIWPNFSNVTLNGEAFTQAAGAGIYIAYSLLNDNAYNVYEATDTYGTTFQIIIKAGDPSIGDVSVPEGTEAAIEDVFVYNYVESNGGFQVQFEDPNADTYSAEAGYTTTYNLVIGSHIIPVVAGDVEDASTNVDLSALGLTEGYEYEAQMYAEYTNGETTLYSVLSDASKFVYKTTKTAAVDRGIAQIHFTSTGGKSAAYEGFYNGNENNKPKIKSALTVIDADGNVNAVNFGTANVRGNSTANAAKKPYNFKFDNKQNVLGMGKAKKWSLLANIFDKTLMRNQIGMDFQRLLETNRGLGQVYTSECQPVDLYIDGEYAGTYTLIESVEVGSTRVDIDIDYANEDTNEIIDETKATTVTIGDTSYTVYDVLLELGNDNRLDDEAYYFEGTLPGGSANGKIQWAINEPEVGGDSVYSYLPTEPDNKPEFVKLTRDYIQAFETALSAGDYDTFKQFIDVDSFVDFYITSEYFMTKDISFSSTRFYIKGGKIYAGPLWDVDLSSGNNGSNLSAENFYAQNFEWFKALMANETFKAKVIERYTELQPEIRSIYATGGKVDQAYNTVVTSANANYTEAYNTKWSSTPAYTGWGYGYIYGNGGFFNQLEQNLSLDQAYQTYGVYGAVDAYDNYEDYITDYKTWLKDRNEWLIAQWGVELTSGLDKTDDGDVVVVWDAVEGATGYSITYTPAASVVEAASLSLFNMSRIMTFAAGEETTIYVDADTTSYNFTDNGINLADNTAVTVGYTTDEVVDATATYVTAVVDEATSDLALFNRVTVDELNATIVTNVTNSGTASAENVVLTLKDSTGATVATQTIEVIEAGATATATWERTEVAGSYTYSVDTGLLTSGVTYTCAEKADETLVWTEMDTATYTTVLEGTKYAEVGTIQGQVNSMTFGTTGYSFNTGAVDRGIVVRLNGKVLHENLSSSALGMSVAYTSLVAGTINTLQIEYIDLGADAETLTTRVKTIYFDVPAEDAPDTSGVDTTAWVEIPVKGTNTDSVEYVYYINEAGYTDYVNTAIWGLFAPHTSTDYHANNAGANCTITGNAIAFAHNTYNGNMSSVWVDDVKYYDDTELFNAANNALEMSTDLFPLADGQTETIHYVAVAAADGTHTAFAIKTEAIAPEAVTGLAYAGTDETPYVWTWTAVDTATSYEVTITDEEGNVVGETITTTTVTVDASAILADAEDGKYTVSVVAVDDLGLKSEATTVEYKKGYVEPEYVDITLDKVEMSYAELASGQTATLTATLTNNGKSITNVNGNIVMHFVTDTASGHSGDENGNILGQTWQVISFADLGLPQDENNNYVFGYGETITFTWTRTITDNFVALGQVRVRATLEGGLANSDNNISDNYYTYEAIASVPNVTSLTSVVNDDKTATLTWTAPEDGNTYTYAIYDAEGTLVATTDTITYTTEALDGTCTYTVKTVNADRESSGVSTTVFVYTEPEASAWAQWDVGFGNTDTYGNSWYYYNGYDWSKIITGAGAEWFGLKNTGHSYVTGTMAGVAVFEFPITGEENSYTSVVVNGTEYTVAENPDVLFTVGNRVYLAQSVFALAEDEEEKVFAITANGNASNSFLIKVVKATTETTTVAEEKPAAPTNLAWAGNADLPYYWSWQGSGADSYNVYVDDVLVINTKSALFNGAEHFADLGNATYTIKVTAVNSAGVESDPVSTLYTKGFTYNNLTTGTETVAQTFTFPTSKEVGGETVYNYVAAGVTATAPNSVGSYTADLAVDGTVYADGNYWRANESAEGEYITIDLGAQKPISEIDLVWDNQNATTLDVLVSTDGVTYTKVADVINGTNTEERLDTLTLSESVTAQYVRVLCKENANGTVYNLREVAIYGTDVVDETTTTESEVVVLDAPTGLAVADDVVTWQAVTDAVSYNVYVNGTLVGNTTTLSYDGTTDFATAGDYTVEVAAVDASGNEGEKASTTYTVAEAETTTEESGDIDYKSLEFVECQNDSNFAVAFVEGAKTEINRNVNEGANLYVALTGNTVKANFQKVTCNGNVQEPPRAGANFWIPITDLKENSYNDVEVIDVNGNTYHFVIRYGTPPEETTTEEPTTVIDITDWVQLNGTSTNNATIWVSQAVADTMGNAGLRGFLATGSANPWGKIPDTAAMYNLPVFGFVTTGTNTTSVVIDGVEYTENGEDVYMSGDCVFINQKYLTAEPGETEYYVITATSSSVGDNGTFIVKVVGEQAPDISGVTVPGDDGWTQITAGAAGGSADGSLYYVPTDTTIVGNDVRELENTGADIAYGGDANNTVTEPAFGFSVIAGNTNGNPASVWIDGVKLEDGESFIYNNVVTIAQSKFAVEPGETKIFYVTLRSVNGTDSTFPVKIVGPEPEDTWGEWVSINDASGANTVDYYYSNLSSNTLVTHSQTRELINTVIFVFNEGLTYAQLDGVDVAFNGAGVEINKENLVEGQEYVLVVGNATKTASVKFKYEPAPTYAPTGVALTSNRGDINSKDDDGVVISWINSDDAVEAGCSYVIELKSGDTVLATVDANALNTSTGFELSAVDYGTYDVVITTYLDGSAVDTQTLSYNYADPYDVSAVNLNVNNTLWEKFRWQTLTWDEVGAAKEYAIYADGVLVGTTTSTTYNVDAYNYANNKTQLLDENGDPLLDDEGNPVTQTTTVGDHTVAVVAVFEGDTVAENYADVNAERVIGTNNFNLALNYIYGNGTNIWNDTGVDSVWNFTISEVAAGGITDGAAVLIDYDTDGAANLTIVDNGIHSGTDQPWTIKAAIYDEAIAVGDLINLSFEIKGPASLVGQTIKIKCCPEEVNPDGSYSNVVYEEETYTFEDDGEGGAVLHYSNSFTSTNSTYDLLFGLGEIEPTTLTLTDASIVNVYGVTSVTATGLAASTSETEDGSLFVQWTTDVPSHLINDYSYTVVVKDSAGNVVKTIENATSGTTYEGFAAGTYTVEVSSIYDGSVTATVSTTATIDATTVIGPDLVISDISFVDNTAIHREGDVAQINVTMKNIGSGDATLTAGNITVWFYVKDVNGNNNSIGYRTIGYVDGSATLAAGESVTYTYDFDSDNFPNATLHDGDYIYTFYAVADADSTVAELTETNNTLTSKLTFYPALEKVGFVNDEGIVSATWPVTGDSSAVGYEVTYTTADGTTKTTSVPVTTTEGATTEALTLPEGTYFANDSQVSVKVVCNDGLVYDYAFGTARADLVIEKLEPVGGVAYVGEEVKFVSVVRNIGVAPAVKKTENEGDQVITVIFTTQGVSGLSGVYGTDLTYAADGSPIRTTLNPNETSTINITNTTHKPTAVGTETYDALVDDVNRILELNDTDGTGVNNNTYTMDMVVLNPSVVGLNLNEPEGQDSYVSATWTDNNILETSDPKLTVEGYQVTYTNADGEVKTVNVDKDFNTYAFTEELKNNTDVIISALYTEFAEKGYIQIAKTKALADLVVVEDSIVITQNGVEVDVPATEREYQISFKFKNIGTASVPSALVPEDNPFLEYGKWILGNLQCSPSEGFECVATPANYSTDGIVAGATDTITFESVTFNKEGNFTLTANIDYPGHVEAEEGGYITESNEDNNSETKDITVKFIQNTEMDWTRLTVADGTTNPYLFPVASGSQNAYIDYKILTSTETNYHYEDIINKYVGYNGANMSIGFAPDKTFVYFAGDDGSNHSYTKFEFAQVPHWSEFVTDENGIVYEKDAEGNLVLDAEGKPIPLETTPDEDSNELVWITLPDKASTIHNVTGTEGNLSETITATDVSDSPMGYNGNGYNFFVGNFGLYKCYLMKFTTPVPALDEFGNYTYDEEGNMLFEYDEEGNLKYDELVVAFRVTDDKIRTNNWMQSLASDGVSNPNTLPIPYCGGDSHVNGDEDGIEDTNKDIIYADGENKHQIVNVEKDTVIDDTNATDNEHEDTEASQNYETIGAIWYDASDILLSSVSIYNGNWLSIATSEYLEISKGDQDNQGTKNMRLGIARAIVDPDQNNKFVGYATDFVVTDPNKSDTHLGIQGTNTIHVGLPWLLEELPTHSDDGGQKDVEYYWIRVWADITAVQETVGDSENGYTQLANYIDIPITVYYDVPQVQPAQNVTAITSYDDNDQEIFSLSWGALDEMNSYGYKYKVFYTNANEEDVDITLDLAKSSGLVTEYDEATQGSYYFDSPQALTSDSTLYDKVAVYDQATNTVTGSLKVVAYWCEQSIPVEVDIQPPHGEGWYSTDGEHEINVLAGQLRPIEINGYMSYYYDRSKNHSSAVIGYNGYFVSLNGNTRWFASNSKVSVAIGTTAGKFVSRTDMKTNYYDALYTEVNAKQDVTTGTLAKTAVDAKETELGLTFKEIKNEVETGYVAGQLQIESKKLFQATNLVTWYLLKVETPIVDEQNVETGEVRVAYIMMESIVEVGGDVAVRGFQMNADATPGGVSEYSPSFRAVSRASKLMADPTDQIGYQENGVNIDLGEDAPLYKTGTTNSLVAAVIDQGTIYARKDLIAEGTELGVTTSFDAEDNLVVTTDTEAGVYHFSTTAGGILTDWPGSVNDVDKKAYTYYAVTFKPVNYTVTGLLWNYSIKAYAVTEYGNVVYENTDGTEVKEASVYKIAKALYSNGGDVNSTARMSNKEEHEFLYNNVLNIVNIYYNYKSVANTMLKKLGLTSKADPLYAYVNNVYKDLYYYAHIAEHYAVDSYINRGTFISKKDVNGKTNEELLLPELNKVKANSDTDYATIADWIYGEMGHGTGNADYTKNGFYEKVEYATPNVDETVTTGNQE